MFTCVYLHINTGKTECLCNSCNMPFRTMTSIAQFFQISTKMSWGLYTSR